jgi:hypothetical protein
MKKLLLLSLLSIFLFSCTSENDVMDTNSELLDNIEVTEGNSRRDETVPVSGQCLQADFIAGQNQIAGLIDVQKDADNLIVTYSTSNGWELDETHLYVGLCSEIPLTGAQNPKIGLFPYQETHINGTTSFTYTIALSELPDCLCISVHAAVSNEVTNESETAWMEGTPFSGNSWAMYVEHCLSDCI